MGIFAGGKATRASGGTVTTAGPYTLHAFTTTGANTFTPTSTGFIDILLIGGGGNSGGGTGAPSFDGGGGAGATLFKKMIPVTAGTPYPISVGTNAANTTFTYSGITTTAFAGGAGATYASGNPGGNSLNASGGGGQFVGGGTAGSGAGVFGIGYPGGQGGSSAGGGGGGGAGGAGNPGVSPGPLQCLGGLGVPISYFTGISTDIVSVGGPGGGAAIPLRITSTSYGSGGAPIESPPSPGPGRPGVAYIRYI